MSGPVLLVITMPGCGACAAFKSRSRDALLSSLKGVIDVKEVSIENLGKYNPELKYKYAKWFPTFILVNRGKLESKSGPLEGIVMAGKMTNKGIEFDKSAGYSFAAPAIKKWVMKHKDNPKLRSSSSGKTVTKGSTKNTRTLNQGFNLENFVPVLVNADEYGEFPIKYKNRTS